MDVSYDKIACTIEIPSRRVRWYYKTGRSILRRAPGRWWDTDKNLCWRRIDWSIWGTPRDLWYMTRLPNVFDLARHRRGRASCECDEWTHDSEVPMRQILLVPEGRLPECSWIRGKITGRACRRTTCNITENYWTTKVWCSPEFNVRTTTRGTWFHPFTTQEARHLSSRESQGGGMITRCVTILLLACRGMNRSRIKAHFRKILFLLPSIKW